MDWSRLVWPMDPIEFRDACLAMMDEGEAKGECPPGFVPNLEFAAAFFVDLWGGSERAAWKPSAALSRLRALVDLVEESVFEEDGDPFQSATEAHVGFLEAAAVCPLEAGMGFDREAFQREAGARVREIDSLDALLGED